MDKRTTNKTVLDRGRRRFAIAGTLSAAMLAVFGAFALINSGNAPIDVTTDDFTVERVPDRILSKISDTAEGGGVQLSDTSYRIRTRTLVADASKVDGSATIEDVYAGSGDEIVDRLLYQSESLSTVYDFGDANDYVAYLDVSGDDGRTEHPQDVVFAYDTTAGEMIDSASYDAETGIAYIPKSVFSSEKVANRAEGTQALQVQTLVRYDSSLSNERYEQDSRADATGDKPAYGELSRKNTMPVTVKTNAGTVNKMSHVPAIGNQFAVKVVEDADAADVELEDISVSINDGAMLLDGKNTAYSEGDNLPSISYNSSTGTVDVHNVSPMQVMNVAVGVDDDAEPSMSAFAAIAVAGEIVQPTENAYKIGFWGQGNISGWTDFGYLAPTKTIQRFAAGGGNHSFWDIGIWNLSDQSCAYAIAIGSCPSALGSYWTADGNKAWKANCVHAAYPNGSYNPPSGGYYKIIDADWNSQVITVAFFITCEWTSQQEGGMVLQFRAPRNGHLDVYKKANANNALGTLWKSSVGNATFGVYRSYSAAQRKDATGLEKTITTDGNGYASASFAQGEYYVREHSAPWPYLVSDQILHFSIKPNTRQAQTMYDDTTPSIRVMKKILPSKNSYVKHGVESGGRTLAEVRTSVNSDGKTMTTVVTAKQDLSNIVVKNAATSVLDSPVSSDANFNAATGNISSLKSGESVTVTQTARKGCGWSNKSGLATICSVSVSGANVNMSLPLLATTLENVKYGIYTERECTHMAGIIFLDANGVGSYGTSPNQFLSPNTTYYVKESEAANGYTISDEVYPVTTGRNNQVTVSASDSFSTVVLTKESGEGKSLTDKTAQFTLRGARYGIYNADDPGYDAACRHDERAVTRTLDGRNAIVTTDKFGNASEVALGAGTYYIAELPSAITRPYVYGASRDSYYLPPSNIDATIAGYEYDTKPNGQFLLDENVYTVTLSAGDTVFKTSKENIPVQLQVRKQSTRSDLTGLSQYSLEGAAFGIYETEAAAKSAPTGKYGDSSFNISYDNAVAIVYGGKDGLTTVSGELPLKDYYVKEVRAPRNYGLAGDSQWIVNGKTVSGEVLHVTANDILASGRYVNGILTHTSAVRNNVPDKVSLHVKKDASEVPENKRTDTMSLANAKFAVYRTYDDAKDDVNRLSFKTDTAPSTDKELLTTGVDGWTEMAVGLDPAQCYWVREIEPPHVGTDVTKSMYVLDSEPVKATFESDTSVAMKAHKDDLVKPISITVGKYVMDMDSQGRDLHIEKNPAYGKETLEGAIFGLFETREAAEGARVTDDVSDVSVADSAYARGAIRVMTSKSDGTCGTVDNLKWKEDGYYVRELKAPTSGCYKRNDAVINVTCQASADENGQHVSFEVDENSAHRKVNVDEVPVYYYVKIEKTSSAPGKGLEGIHFGIYDTLAKAQSATGDNPGAPLYNLYTKAVQRDGKTHYEAITGVTGPGTFYAKELVKSSDPSNGYQVLEAPIPVTAYEGGVPVYETTPIVPENSAPKFDPKTGLLSYKTARDIDIESGTGAKAKVAINASEAPLGHLNEPVGAPASVELTNNKADVVEVAVGESSDDSASLPDDLSMLNPMSDDMMMAFASTYTFKAGTGGYFGYTEHTGYLYSVPSYESGTGSSASVSAISVPTVNGNSVRVDRAHYAYDTMGGAFPGGLYDWTTYVAHANYGYTFQSWSRSGNTYTANFKANNYTITFNTSSNGGSGANPTSKTVSYNGSLGSVSKPTKPGYNFIGYYDSPSGGIQYYNANGVGTRNWNKTSSATLYAQFTPITYYVKYVPNSSNNTNGISRTTTAYNNPITCTYDSATTIMPGVIYKKFGEKQTGWTINGTAYATDGKFKNLVTSVPSNGPGTYSNPILIVASWSKNNYNVRFNNGLTTSWGPTPSVASGYSLNYTQTIGFDDYSSDGWTKTKLTANQYSHPYFKFQHWVDANGTQYANQQEVCNLANPNMTKELFGVWIPDFDYGVDCKANIIENQPLGGITVQKAVTSGDNMPSALSDLSGITFGIYSDSACATLLAQKVTDATGALTFTGMNANTDYYVKELSIPDRLKNVMSVNANPVTVRTGQKSSYKVINELKQLMLTMTKKPSKKSVDSIGKEIVNDMPPTGAKFAVYASEADARADDNRLSFYNESDKSVKVMELTREIEIDGIKCVTADVKGLPVQDLWVREIAAPDHGNHEYALNPDPIRVAVDSGTVSGNITHVSASMENDIEKIPDIYIRKRVSDADLSVLPKQQRESVSKLVEGVEYAIYKDRAEATARTASYFWKATVHDGVAKAENIPYGIYYAIEWSIPQSSQDKGLMLSNEVIEIKVNRDTVANGVEIEATDPLEPENLYMKKVDADTSTPIAGVVFHVYTDESKSELLCSTDPTDANGIAKAASPLLPGDYFVQEDYTSLPGDYNGNGLGTDRTEGQWVTLFKDSDAAMAFVVKNAKNDETGSIDVRKRSTNPDASLEGAVFSVYDAAGALVGSMTTDADGYAKLDDIPIGRYTVRETTTLPLHSATEDAADAPEYEVTVTPNACVSVNGSESVTNYQGYVKVHKESAAPELTDAQPETYSLAGATYSLYPIVDEEVSSVPLSVTMVTDEDGESNVIAVPLGKYKVVETTEPANFSTPAEDKEFEIEVTSENETQDKAVIVNSKDSPLTEPMSNFVVEKRSAETFTMSDGAPQGATSMRDTKFEISYTSVVANDYAEALSCEKQKHWYVETDDDGRVTLSQENILNGSDELFFDVDGNAAIPVGTIVVKEVVPPAGYTIGVAPTAAYRFNGDNMRFEEFSPNEDDVTVLESAPTFTAANDIYRADISFKKTDAYDAGKKMANIPFLLTLLDADGSPLERHLVFTDENGLFSSKDGSVADVNANDQYIPGDVEHGKVDAAPVKDTRVWFSGSQQTVTPDAGKGALIYGDYELREYSTPATAHYQELAPIYFSVRGADEQSWVEVNGEKMEDGDLTQAVGEIRNHSIHVTKTVMLDNASKAHVAGNGSLSATETVQYADATPGEKYIFETLAYDVDTKEPIISKPFADIDGEMVTVQAGGTYTLECDSEIGNVQIGVSFDDHEYDVTSKKVGLVTRVYHNGYLSDTHNATLTDDDEAISFSTMGTVAVDSDTRQHVGNSDGRIDVTDTVSYTNLVPGLEYVAKGTLMDKTTGQPLKDADGNIVTGEAKFVPTERNGEVEVKFSFAMQPNFAFTAVVFEKVLLDGVEVIVHEDIDDTEQTVFYPSVITTASDAATKTFQGNAQGETVTVSDEIAYNNLIPGREYETRGILYTLDEGGNKHEIEGSAATKAFTPAEANGTVTMMFTAPASEVIGRRVMVGESVWSENKIVASHDDAKFEEQIVSYPSVATEAFDVASGSHVGNGKNDTDVMDVVMLAGLKPGETYRIDGTVMERDKDGKVTSTNVTATETFTAKAADEEHRISFRVPKSFLTRDIVVYERISSGDGAHLLATHDEPNDESQSVHYPKIGTVALYPDGGTHVGSNVDNKIVDTVAYENLMPGYSYEVVGMLVDKETGEFVVTKPDEQGKSEPVVSSTKFTATSPDGTVEVPFAIDGVDVSGKTIVVYEQLFVVPADNTPVIERTLIATHEDIEDKDQSVFYPHIKTTALDRDNKTHVGSSVVPTAIIDTVEYENLVPGFEYEVHGILMDVDTGEAVTVGNGDDAKPVTAQVSFTPTEASGKVEIPFEELAPEATLDRTFVAYEKLLLKGFSMAEHEDITDTDQSVSYPKIMTTAKDSDTLLHEGYIDELEKGYEDDTVTIVDTVEYSHLVPGREYKVAGKLVNRYEFYDDDEEADDPVEGDENVEGDDANAGDEGEPVAGSDDGNGNSPATGDDDTGAPSDEDENPFADGDMRTAVSTGETTFTPEGESGTVEVEFEVKKKDVYGGVFVAYERLLDAEGNIVSRHEDIKDEAQTVSYPKIGTTAGDGRTFGHVGSNEDIDIRDIVRYEGMLEGHDYIASGILMDKASEQPVTDENGNVVTGETRFTADKEGKGETIVTFSAQLPKEQLEGRTFVAFEKVFEAPEEEADEPETPEVPGSEPGEPEAPDNPDNPDHLGEEPGDGDETGEPTEPVVIATHEDIDDEEQSIHYPRIRTYAQNEDGAKMIPFMPDAVIVDTVTYENLVPGLEYTIDGVMMNKQQNRELMASGAPVTATATFTPASENGETTVRFEFDGTRTEPCVGVAFETLKFSGHELAEHRDIDDVEQSVYVAGVADELRGNETPLGVGMLVSAAGDAFGQIVFAAMAASLVVIGGMAYHRRRRA